MTQGNDLVPHEAADVRRLAERGVSHHIEVREAREAERLADAMPAGFLDIQNELGGLIDAISQI